MRKCVFCDYPATLTKEHIWAEWLRDFIPRDSAVPDRALHTTGLSWVDESGRYQSTMNVRGDLARPGEMMRMGGLVLSMVRTCTGEVWVRSTWLVPSAWAAT